MHTWSPLLYRSRIGIPVAGSFRTKPHPVQARLRRQILQPRRWDRRTCDVDEDAGVRRVRLLEQLHADLARKGVSLAAVARRARRDDVVPARLTALGSRDHVIDGQVGAGAA